MEGRFLPRDGGERPGRLVHGRRRGIWDRGGVNYRGGHQLVHEFGEDDRAGGGRVRRRPGEQPRRVLRLHTRRHRLQDEGRQHLLDEPVAGVRPGPRVRRDRPVRQPVPKPGAGQRLRGLLRVAPVPRIPPSRRRGHRTPAHLRRDAQRQGQARQAGERDVERGHLVHTERGDIRVQAGDLPRLHDGEGRVQDTVRHDGPADRGAEDDVGGRTRRGADVPPGVRQPLRTRQRRAGGDTILRRQPAGRQGPA